MLIKNIPSATGRWINPKLKPLQIMRTSHPKNAALPQSVYANERCWWMSAIATTSHLHVFPPLERASKSHLSLFLLFIRSFHTWLSDALLTYQNQSLTDISLFPFPTTFHGRVWGESHTSISITAGLHWLVAFIFAAIISSWTLIACLLRLCHLAAVLQRLSRIFLTLLSVTMYDELSLDWSPDDTDTSLKASLIPQTAPGLQPYIKVCSR